VLTDDKTAQTRRRARILQLAGCAALVLAVAVLVTTGWTAYANWSDAKREADITQSNRTYLRTINNTLNEVDDAETGQRGYLLTGREHYLAPYNRALGPLNQNLKVLKSLAAARPKDQATIDRLETLIQAKLAELDHTISLRRNQGINAAMAEILTDKGLLQMEQIRDIVRAAADTQRADVAQQSSDAATHQLAAVRLSAAGGFVLLCLMTAGFLALNSGAIQQTRLAERLADSKEVFETTLTSIGDAVIASDTRGQITFINPEAAHLTGWPRAEAVGKHLDDVFKVVDESSRSVVTSPFESVMRSGSVVGLANHTTLLRKDGSEIPVDDSGAPIRDVRGQLTGVVLVFRDVSQRRKAEAALELSHGEVLKANEELRQFSYAATHDLQEPLRTIVVFSQLLGRGYKQILDERGQHLLQTVEDAAHRMSLLIDDLLAYTRAGGLEFSDGRAVNASDILNETLVQLHGAIVESSAVVTHRELPAVWADDAQLSQVFQNLISNAIKYRRPGVAPIIDVSYKIDGDKATFQVSDNGIGFKQEYSDRIFLLFQRLHGRAIPGTGIGLALCRRIVERYGGRIWARSEENVGTTFYFTLPLALARVLPAEAALRNS
jgi:PAS domain S-box-containing protein